MGAREKAIDLMKGLIDRLARGGQVGPKDEVEDIVDAIIDAARAPESTHTRAIRTAGNPRQG